MKYKNILVKELYSRKYRNRIKRSKKGKGSFKRLKRVKAEGEQTENKNVERSANLKIERRKEKRRK